MKTLPTINEILENAAVKSLISKLSRGEVVSTALLVLGELAQQTRESALEMTLPTVTDVANRIADKLTEGDPARLVPTINATGKLFPDQLGCAPMAPEAVNAIEELAHDYAAMGRPLGQWNKDAQLKSVEKLVATLTGAESVMAVNSAVGAWYLILKAVTDSNTAVSAHDNSAGNTMSESSNAGKSVLISRRHLFELPESCRITDIFSEVQVPYCEIGSVNHTSVADYQNAITGNTAAILYVCSTDKFDSQSDEIPSIALLAKIAKTKKIPLIVDCGINGLLDGTRGEAKSAVKEESVSFSAQGCLSVGADAVIMRSHFLFGGPVCSLILGKKSLLEKCKSALMFRGLSCSELITTALERTLMLYSQPDRGINTIPTQQILHVSQANLSNRATRLQRQLAVSPLVKTVEMELVPQYALNDSWQPIFGSTCRLIITPRSMTAVELGFRLAMASPAVKGYIQDNTLVLDLRTVLPSQDISLAEAFENR